jgi:D-sedoheptulose 7-phosphate isomerase
MPDGAIRASGNCYDQTMTLRAYLSESAKALAMASDAWSEDLVSGAISAVTGALRAGKPLLVCGNGGSASDAMHITCELVGRFLMERRPLNAICLSSNPAFLTAWANDYSYDAVFSRQVEAYGQPGAVLLGISTSGNSENVVGAMRQARSIGMTTIALTGAGGGKLAHWSDYLFAVPSKSTPLIQQVHVCLYHYLCEAIERDLQGEAREPVAANLSSPLAARN